MDTRIALAGSNPDIYGALMRGWQGGEQRIQDVNAQQDRTALIGALSSRYADQPTTGVLARLAPEVLQNEQKQAEFAQELNAEKAKTILYAANTLDNPELDQAERAEMFKYVVKANPGIASGLMEAFQDSDFSSDSLRQIAVGYGASAPEPTAGQRELDNLVKMGNFSPKELERLARIQAGFEGKAEPVQSTPEAVGESYTDAATGREFIMRSNPDGSVTPYDTGGTKAKETPPHVGRAITAASDEWQKSTVDADNAEALAAQFEQDNPPGGVGGQTSEAVKGFFGTEDGISALRYRWISMRNSRVLELLPPGAASETDVQRVQAGFPDDFTNPKVVSEFLRSMANISRVKAEYDRFKADYLSTNQGPEGMLEAWYKIRPKQGKTVGKTAKQRAAELGIK